MIERGEKRGKNWFHVSQPVLCFQQPSTFHHGKDREACPGRRAVELAQPAQRCANRLAQRKKRTYQPKPLCTCMTLSSSPIPLHSTPYSSISPSHTYICKQSQQAASYRTSHLYKLPRKHRASEQHEHAGASTVGTAITLASVMMATRNPSSAGKE